LLLVQLEVCNHQDMKSMVPTAEERTAHERYSTYIRGWRQGAGIQPMDPKFSEHPTLGVTYQEGYADGQKARSEAGRKAAKRFGYKPSILRLCQE
jgi:hypothetical protein